MRNYVNKKIHKDGYIYYLNEKGDFHRTDGPAKEWEKRDDRDDGDKEWFINGKRHRIDGPALITCFEPQEYVYESRTWFVNNKFLHDEQQINKLQDLRKTINDDELLNELLLSGKLVL